MLPLLAASPALLLMEVGVGLSFILCALWWLNRRMHGGGDASRKVIRLTPQDAVHVVEVDGKRLLLGTGVGGPPRLLCELAPLVAPSPSVGPGAATTLRASDAHGS